VGWKERELGRDGVGRVDVWLPYCSEIVRGQCVSISYVSKSFGILWSSIELLASRAQTFDYDVRDKK